MVAARRRASFPPREDTPIKQRLRREGHESELRGEAFSDRPTDPSWYLPTAARVDTPSPAGARRAHRSRTPKIAI